MIDKRFNTSHLFLSNLYHVRDLRYITLGHWSIEVIFATNPKHQDGTDVYGLWSSRYKTITLDESLDDLQLVEIFWHEMAHAILEYFGADDDMGINSEMVCQSMGRGMALLLKDNPQLWEIMNDM